MMKKLTLSLCALALGACSTVSTSQLNLNLPRNAPAAVAVNDQVYVMGGENRQGARTAVEKIDLKQHSVTKLSTKLIPRTFGAAVDDGNGYIYVMGGLSPFRLQGFVPTPVVEVLDTHTGEVLYARNLPHPRSSASVVRVGHKIYVIGGSTIVQKPLFRISASARVDILDLDTQTWSEGANMPQAAETKAVVYNGQIYTVGGDNFINDLPMFARYDPATDKWQRLDSAPFPLSAESAVVVDDKLLTFGSKNKLELVMQYDFNQQKWQRLRDVPFRPSRNQGIAKLDDKVVIVGGSISGKDSLDDIQVLNDELLTQ